MGQTDFTGIVNSVQMLTQMVGQGNKALLPALSVPEPPTPGPSNTLDMIRINAAGTAYETRTPTQVLSDLSLQNAVPVGIGASAVASSISATTSSFTAPSSGALVLIGKGTSNGRFPNSATLTTTLAGLVIVFTALVANSTNVSAFGYLPMSATQNTTATFTFTVSGGGDNLRASIVAFFLPQA